MPLLLFHKAGFHFVFQMFSDIKTLKAIANRTMFGGAKSGSRMQPPSVGAQFQVCKLIFKQ